MVAAESAIVHWSSVWQYVGDAFRIAYTEFPLRYDGETQPLAIGVQGFLIVTFLCWLLSVLTRNYSYVDRVWSIAPIAYVWHVACFAYTEDQHTWNARLVVMAVLTTLWGLRLSYNFYRKGGYNVNEEDYRWGILRQRMPWWAYQLFNIVFIAGYQNLLVFLFTVPAYAALAYRSVAFNVWDVIATLLFLGLLALETVADQQQWEFYQRKYAMLNANEPLTGDYAAGFNRSGLFRYSRHPNYFGEQAIWWAFYLFGVASSHVVINPTIIGTVLLTLLFTPSAIFTESISAAKYPEYKTYQKTVSMMIPWFPSRQNDAAQSLLGPRQ